MLDDGPRGSKNEIAVQTILRVTERRDDAYGIPDSETCYAAADGINLTGSLQTELCGKGRRRNVGRCTEVDLRAIEPDGLQPNSDSPAPGSGVGTSTILRTSAGPVS